MGSFLDYISKEMRLRNFSPKTIKAYQHAIEDIRTTQQYTRLTNPAIKNIKSPL